MGIILGLMRYSQESFIDKAKSIHGDEYDYSKVKFITVTDVIDIVCRQHGLFSIRAGNHIYGNKRGRCPECVKIQKINECKSRTQLLSDVIDEANVIHGNKYDYSLIKDYRNRLSKVDILCKTHGLFSMTFKSHIYQRAGCPKCKNEQLSMDLRDTVEEFICKARQIHGDLYDYSKVKYINARTPVIIICKEHGEFIMKPINHTYKCNKCNKCAGRLITNLDEFIAQSKKVHSDTYDYSRSIYTKFSKKIEIICKIHGSFWQFPRDHSSGHGCIKCGNELRNKKNTMKLDEFIEKARKVHADRYDYSKVEYIHNKKR